MASKFLVKNMGNLDRAVRAMRGASRKRVAACRTREAVV